jgi:hypothetical protein
MARDNERDRDRDLDEEDVKAHDDADRAERPEDDPLHPNPPYTSTERMASPKFGSAGSGGLENEPGPERD